MKKAALAAVALCAAAACKPAVKGRCNDTADCRKGAYCSLDGICLASSGTCTPACGDGEICSGSTCAALKPVVSVVAPSGPLSPALPLVTVHVDAAAAIALHGIAVSVDSPDKTVASGSLPSPKDGDNLVTLGSFEAGAVGTVSVRATLTYLVPGAAAEEQVSSVAVPAAVDNAPPSVTVFVPAAADAVNGWVPRTSATLEVRATVDDGAGSGAQAATLSFDLCPGAAPCSYAGTVLSQAAGSTVFSFQVPRTAQAALSEAPLAITVKATDLAGNQGQGAGTVRIDDAPPQIGAIALISATGVTGEDGKTWFIGGPGAAAVEIAVPVADGGAGFASLALHLDALDLYAGFPAASLDVAGTPMADGVHFLLPAGGVHGREQHLRFTLTAADSLQHVATLGPDDPQTMIWVDAVPPVFAFPPRVTYSSAAPQGACGPADSSTFQCGRRAGTHLLADDSATVTFDVYDCGVGVADASATVSTTAGGAQPAQVNGTGKTGTPCSAVNGSTNKTHHYSFTLNLATQAPALDPPVDTAGTTLVQLAADAQDKLGQASHAASAGGATSGDGLAVVSLWRWRSLVASGSPQPTGSPALIPGTTGARQVAVGTNATGGGPNVFVVSADGTQAWSATVLTLGVAGDVAAGPSGRLYMVAPPASNSCSPSCSSAFHIILPPASGSTGTVHTCSPVSNVSFGAPPALVGNSERAVVASTGHATAATANVFLFEENGGCQAGTPALVGVGDYFGISANWPTIFLATGQGFTSIDRNVGDTGFDATTQRAYTPSSGTVPTLSPPAVASSPLRALFGSTDHTVRTALQSTCTTTIPCWIDDSAFPAAQAGKPVPFTPVFDGSIVYAADDHAKVYAFPRSSGGPAPWSQDAGAALPAPWPSSTAATVSDPVLLQGGAVLVVRADGIVALVSQPGVAPLLQVAAVAAPPAPAVETRGGDGVAYVADGAGWLWALQVPGPPLAAGQNVWPRPGRDSCNSRNAASQCQ